MEEITILKNEYIELVMKEREMRLLSRAMLEEVMDMEEEIEELKSKLSKYE